MRAESLQAPESVARLLGQDAAAYAEIGASLRQGAPDGVVTVARGSSDHAAHFMSYLVMARLGRLVTSLPMSLVTLHRAPLQTRGIVAMGFSQSGRSPDLVAPLKYFREGRARTVAIVNDVTSPLAAQAKWVLPLHAGQEVSVAATKSYIAQLVAGARLVAAWEDDSALCGALSSLPEHLHAATLHRWESAVDSLVAAQRLFVIGRGTGLAIAMEAALKFKETCGIQAEAFSGAEVQHGPMALVDAGYPLLIFAPRGPAQAGLIELAQAMRQRGGRVLLAAPCDVASADLPLATAAHPDLDPIVGVQSFYLMVEALARARGMNPDEPRHLAKVTCTQ